MPLILDRAYEDNETRQSALDFGWVAAVPHKSNRLEPWLYDKAIYKKRNQVKRLFRRLKGFQRIFSRFESRFESRLEKLDLMFLAFIHFALIVEGLGMLRHFL